MRWRSYMPLILPLAIALGWLVMGRQEGMPSDQGQVSRDSSDAFYEEIAPRRSMIETDLKTGQHKPWESTFYDGSPTRGFARGWIISLKRGYVSTTRRLDMGSVKNEGNRIALVSEAPRNAWGLMPLEYVVVPWDQQVFLVEPDQLLAFCNDVNSGRLRRCTPAGRYLLRVKDFDKERPTGLPKVPTPYKEYLLRRPITGSVVKAGEEKQDVAVRGEKRLMSGTSLTLSVGKKDGVRTGMQFYPERDSETAGFSSFFVISLAERQCELLQCRDDRKDQAKIGLRLTTADPFYDRK